MPDPVHSRSPEKQDTHALCCPLGFFLVGNDGSTCACFVPQEACRLAWPGAGWVRKGIACRGTSTPLVPSRQWSIWLTHIGITHATYQSQARLAHILPYPMGLRNTIVCGVLKNAPNGGTRSPCRCEVYMLPPVRIALFRKPAVRHLYQLIQPYSLQFVILKSRATQPPYREAQDK